MPQKVLPLKNVTQNTRKMHFQCRSGEKISIYSASEVECKICFAIFSIANSGKSSIEQHTKTEKHVKALQQKSAPSVSNYFAPAKDLSTAAYEGVWAYHIIQANHSFASADCASKLLRTCFAVHNFHMARTICHRGFAKRTFGM